VRLETPPQVRLLIDQRQWKFIRPFIDARLSVRDAADASGIALEALYPQVRRFAKHGLLRVVDTRVRKGRDIKVYSAVGRTFFIPVGALEIPAFELPDVYFGQVLADSGIDFMYENVGSFVDPGLQIAPLDDLQIRMVAAPGVPLDPLELRAAVWEWKLLRLSPERARQLQFEIHDAIDRAVAEQAAEGDMWILNARYVPVGRSVDQSDFWPNRSTPRPV
jgi:hypothetical protein